MLSNQEDKRFDEQIRKKFEEFDYSAEFSPTSDDLLFLRNEWENFTFENKFRELLLNEESSDSAFNDYSDFNSFHKKYLKKGFAKFLLLATVLCILLSSIFFICLLMNRKNSSEKLSVKSLKDIHSRYNSNLAENIKYKTPETLGLSKNHSYTHAYPSTSSSYKIKSIHNSSTHNHNISKNNNITLRFSSNRNLSASNNIQKNSKKVNFNSFPNANKVVHSGIEHQEQNQILEKNSDSSNIQQSQEDNSQINHVMLPVKPFKLSEAEPEIRASGISDSVLIIFPILNSNPIRWYVSSNLFFGKPYNNSSKVLNGFGTGLLFQKKLGQNISIHPGIGASILFHHSEKIFYKKKIEYGFGKSVDSVLLVPVRSYYISFPFLCSYQWKKFQFEAGISWEYHLKSFARFEEYQINYHNNATRINNQKIYEILPDFKNAHNLMFRLRSEYNINKQLGIDMQYMFVKYPFLRYKNMNTYSLHGFQMSLIYKFRIK